MAVQDPTTNYGWNLPNDGGDSGNWGSMLRTILGDDSTGIDAKLKAVSDVADAANARPFRARASLASDISVTAVTHVIDWDTEDFDSDDLFETVTNPSRITIPSDADDPTPVILSAIVNFDLTEVGAASDIVVEITKNGAQIGAAEQVYVAAEDRVALCVTLVDEASPDDYYEVQIATAADGDIKSGSSQSSFFMIAELK